MIFLTESCCYPLRLHFKGKVDYLTKKPLISCFAIHTPFSSSSALFPTKSLLFFLPVYLFLILCFFLHLLYAACPPHRHHSTSSVLMKECIYFCLFIILNPCLHPQYTHSHTHSKFLSSSLDPSSQTSNRKLWALFHLWLFMELQ